MSRRGILVCPTGQNRTSEPSRARGIRGRNDNECVIKGTAAASTQISSFRLMRSAPATVQLADWSWPGFVDTLLHHATAVHISGESYWLKDKRRAGLMVKKESR